MDELRLKITLLESQIATLNAKVDMLSVILGASRGAVERLPDAVTPFRTLGNQQPTSGSKVDHMLMDFTLKQHAVMQLLMLGKKTYEVAEIMGVTESTIKVHIRSIGQKYGSTKRVVLQVAYREAYEAVSPERYLSLTRVPADWAANPEAYPDITRILKEKVR